MFNIANGVDGSPISYTINYTINSHSGFRFYNEVISCQSCVNGTCEYDQDQVSPSTSLLSLSSDNNITVTVSGIKIKWESQLYY